MRRLATFDVSQQFSRPPSQLAAQLLFGAACAAMMILVRSAIDISVQTTGPFALVYPAVLVAVLYGRWRAGLVAYVISFTWAWYYVLPPSDAFTLESAPATPAVAINAMAALIVLVLAETFCQVVASAVEERDAEIKRRVVLLQELEHRTKNNFALVLSLLETQKREEADPKIQRALELTTARIHSFARVYGNLAQSEGTSGSVAMRPYLREVVTHFSDGGFHERIKVSFRASDCSLPREVAVALGLFTNEALTNCAKYAFAAGRDGHVRVHLCGDARQWELIVSDDGIGDCPVGEARGCTGRGTTLLGAFAQQAHAEYTIDTSDRGRVVRLASV